MTIVGCQPQKSTGSCRVYGSVSDSSMEGRVSLGNTVTVYDVEMEEEVSYKIVGSTEADPAKNWISNESPVGAALLGMQEGETVTVTAPIGEFELKVLHIEQ